jgi:hypothetical protein
MRAFVFTDESLKEQAGRFVWLEINTEKRENASVKQKFPVEALPTYLVVDPNDEKVVLRWVGGATVPQLHKLLDEAQLAFKNKGRTKGLGADQVLARADQLYGAGSNAEAATAYRDALAKAPKDWPHYARTVDALLFALSATDQNAAGAQLALAAFPRVRTTPSAANVAGSGLDCALNLAADDTMRPRLVAALEADARAVVADLSLPIAADDRSGTYIALLSARQDANDVAGAKQVAAAWSAFLDGEAAKAKTADERAVYDPHRLDAYIELGQPERAVPMLEQSERDLPDDYNPPARLATAYNAMKKWDEALAANDRALAKAYGPRQLRILQTRVNSYVGRGDTAAARKTLEEALRLAESLPPGQRSEDAITALKKKLEAMQQPQAPGGQ